MDVLEEGQLCESTARRGTEVLARLRETTKPVAGVVDVRGIGFMVGIEFTDAEFTARVRAECINQHMLILSCGAGDNVLRLIPPLTISDDELEQALGILERAILAA
jgi:4-aminobutyrate aminotransferase-like enzyme